ncbi:hypothetical protein ACA910_022172 [Epithemia clementina (nom. ined.)]
MDKDIPRVSSMGVFRSDPEIKDEISPPLNSADVKTADGTFKRRDAGWRSFISNEEGAEFPAEAGRYHLYVAAACPWAHRTLIVRKLKGLEDVISTTTVMPTFRRTKPDQDSHAGWVFGNPNGEPYENPAGSAGPFPAYIEGCEPDPEFGAFSIREIYERCGDSAKLYSVPLLWDKKTKTIVSNESSEIIRMLNSQFNAFAKHPKVDLYPENMRTRIDAVNEWIYSDLNNGVYRCGFCKTQDAYEQAITTLTEAFDKVDSILQRSRFIAGDRFTEADVRLFVTLVRFDEVYTVYFKTNSRMVSYTHIVMNYCREIFQMKGIEDTINMDQIKQHYYTSHPSFNQFSIIAKGNNFMERMAEGHDRWKIGGPLGFLFGFIPF